MLDVVSSDSQFQFDDATHTYRVDGSILPSVTTIIKPLFGDFYTRLDKHVLEDAAQRGTAVHALTEHIDRGDPFDIDDYGADMGGYRDAWRAFLRDSRAVIIGIEGRNYHPALRYAGTYDRLMDIDGERGILDIKTTSQLMPQTAIQTEGYRLIEEAWHPRPGRLRRWAVQLRADGNYRFEEYHDPADTAVFLGLLAAHNWRMSHQC